MRVLVFHGYLLRGTGSNIYNAHLAQALVALGHEVHLLCQDREAAELGFVDAVGRWVDGALEVSVLREPVRCTAYLPDIGSLLPVYVADRYEDFDARPFLELGREQLEGYLRANVAAVRAVVARVDPDVALANHAVMGPAILRRALGGSVPYAVKIHGSALEYTVRRDRSRFGPYVHEGLAGAQGVLVGSGHIARVLWELAGADGLAERTRLGPPGVDVASFRPRPVAEAARNLTALATRLDGAGGGWGGEADAADQLRRLDPHADRLVSFVGKLIVSKGVDLLLAAWPLVVAAVPDARLVVVGFGTFSDGLRRLLAALGRGDLDDARAVAAAGRALEGGPPGELRYLAAFLDRLDGERREAYLATAGRAAERVHFTGRLEHDDLPDLLPACQAQVVPSTFPEAFGMVAAEAAACGALPLCAAHSGLAEVTSTLAAALPEPLRWLLSFEPGPEAVEQIAGRLVRWLELEPAERAGAAAALAGTARARYGWEGVARGVIAAAEGRLDELDAPGGSPAPLRPPSG